jgi:hypothetical protein
MPRLLYQGLVAPIGPQEAVTADKWHLLLSEPMRGRVLAAVAIAANWGAIDPSALLFESAGLGNAATPAVPVMVRTVRRFAYQAMAAPPSPLASLPPETVTVDKWWLLWADPARPMRLLPGLLGPVAAGGLPLAAAVLPTELTAERVLHSPGRRRLLATAGRRRRLPCERNEMRLATPFDPIEVGETDTFVFDFTADVETASVVATSWGCQLAPHQAATDPAPQARVLSVAVLNTIQKRSPVDGSSQVLTGWFSAASIGGLPVSAAGGTYILEATVTLSDGRVLKLNSTVLCTVPGP